MKTGMGDRVKERVSCRQTKKNLWAVVPPREKRFSIWKERSAKEGVRERLCKEDLKEKKKLK